MLLRWFAVAQLALCLQASAQRRTVAITVDDLPYASRTDTALTQADADIASEVNSKLLKAFKKYNVR